MHGVLFCERQGCAFRAKGWHFWKHFGKTKVVWGTPHFGKKKGEWYDQEM